MDFAVRAETSLVWTVLRTRGLATAMRCSKCDGENPEGKRFCGDCGAALGNHCPRCSADNPVGKRFCGDCGAALAADGAIPRSSSLAPPGTEIPVPTGQRHDLASPDGERRHLTVLFSDLVGSTEISARVDPEEFREIVAEYHECAAGAIRLLGGRVAKYLGDGVLAYFGWPEAHDDDAERAARAGLAIIDAVGNLHDHKKRPGRSRLSVRVGIDSGIVVIGRDGSSESEVFGDAANIAARIQAAADPNTVVVSGAAHRLVSGLFIVEPCGPQHLKGIAEPVALFRVVRLSGARSRLAASAPTGLTRFIGREDELRLLMNRWNRARDGEGQAVLIVGEAGIGKSRLVREFRQQLAPTAHTWNECVGAPYFQNTPFHPIVDMLQEGFAQRGQRSNEAKLGELERDLELAGVKPAEAVPLIAPLLNIGAGDKYSPLLLSPEQQRKRLLATLGGWLAGSARSQTVVMTVEDLHWFDASSLELIHLLLEQGATCPLLLLCTARPEFRPPWKLRAHHSQLMLNRLSSSDVREMIATVVAQTALSSDAIEKVVERTAGVPLFVEELTRAVIESKDSTQAASEIPHTLHDSLMARLDRLGSAKQVAQIASVIGSEFSYELLRAVASLPENDLQTSLKVLGDAELIYQRGIPPDATYSFKHALIRDAAYEALLKSGRRDLHRRVAQRITENFADAADQHPEMLARHWTAAGEAEPAIAAWKKAGDAADRRRAFKEAEEDYRQALAILNTQADSPEHDARELQLMIPFIRVLQVTQGYGARQTVETASRTRALAERLHNLPELALQMFGVWGAVVTEGDLALAAALADQLLGLAEREGSPLSLGLAHVAQVLSRCWCGDLTGAEKYFIDGTPFFESAWEKVPGVAAILLSNTAFIAWMRGRPNLARDRISNAIMVADRLNSPFETATAEYLAAWLYIYLRSHEQASTFAAQSLALSEKFGFPQVAAFARIVLGRSKASLGHSAEAVDDVSFGLRELAKTETRNTTTQHLTWLAEAQTLNGATTEALATIDQALKANPQELSWRLDALRVSGDLRVKLGQTDEAEADLRRAIALAQEMSAKTLELRAATELARLLRDTNRREEARKMLAEIYNWFTEGFDTADLKEAKALLDELNERQDASASS